VIRAIFWDNDGVLVDTERLYFQSTQDVFARAGIDLTVSAPDPAMMAEPVVRRAARGPDAAPHIRDKAAPAPGSPRRNPRRW